MRLEMKILKKNQIDSRAKTTISEMKMSLYGLIADQTLQEKTKIGEIEMMAIRTTNVKYTERKNG